MSSLRIGIVCYPSVGGSGILATRLGLLLASRGHEIHLIASELPVEIQNGNEATFFHFHKVNVPDYPLFRYPPFEMVLATEVLKCGREHELDIVHVHYAVPLAASAHYARLMGGAPYVVTLHGSDTHTIGANPQFQAPIRHALLGASCCSAVCEFLKKKAQENFGVTNVRVIPNFVQIDRFNKEKKSTDVIKNPDLPTVVHISNFRPIKRTHDIIIAWRDIKTEIPDAQLYLVGNGPEREFMIKFSQKLKLDDSIHFTGVRKDTEAILSQADLFILASELEASPLTLLEAMASGVPIIATQVGGVPEIVEDGIQ
ncbi:MAG: N-acetyl-alpha-D-glucosaminyl L-malate synthase BshA, partial [Candidatus Hodarchaeota archaeon]